MRRLIPFRLSMLTKPLLTHLKGSGRPEPLFLSDLFRVLWGSGGRISVEKNVEIGSLARAPLGRVMAGNPFKLPNIYCNCFIQNRLPVY